MASLPLWLLLLLFAAAAAVVWIAGVQLSKTTDVLDTRLHLGAALGGTIVLAVATNLPEIAIAVTAALSGKVEIAVGNILGGIAIQTVVLVFIDRFGVRGKSSLTYRAASLSLVIEGVVVTAILAVVIAGSQLPPSVAVGGVAPASVLIVAAWIVGLLLVRRAGKDLPWDEKGDAPDSDARTSTKKASSTSSSASSSTSSSTSSSASSSTSSSMSTRKAALIFATAAAATLVGGVVLEQAGDAAAGQVGLSGILFGATVLALATSLPELSTGIASARSGSYKLAISDIFGGNAFLPVLFLVIGLLSGTPALPGARGSDVYLTALAALLTLVYVVGLVFRPRRTRLGVGIDSLIVLIVYLVGVAGLVAIAG